jgi:serine/threonine-protein kinase
MDSVEVGMAATVHAPAGQAGAAGDTSLGSTDFSLSEAAVESHGGHWPAVPGYEIVGEIARGGMGVVYKARQRGLNRWTALKMILAGAHAGEQQRARFHTEAEAVALLQHPNIVQIYEVGEHDGLPYFSLELVDGGSLDRKIHRQAQPPREAARVVEILADAMDYAHAHAIIHRDLKPANVLLTTDGQLKITDFGLAKRLEGDSSQTKSGTVMGTPSYMAPEQAKGDTHGVGPLADVYALGAMLYELLTGRPPFQAATAMETMLQVTRDEPLPPTQLAMQVPRDLETVCLKCLQKEAHKRYASAGALAEDLRRFLAGEPVMARPIGALGRLGRWCRRNPKLALLSALVFILLVVVAATSSVAYWRIKQEQAETVRQFARAEENAQQQMIARRLADEKTIEAKAAEKKSADNARIASEQRQLALQTLYGLVTKVEEKMRDKEDMSELRKDILKSAMDGLGQVSRSVETAPLADRSMGVALQRMGDYLYQMGRTEEALKQFNLSLTIFRKLEADDPQNDWLAWNSAISYDKLGQITYDLQGDAAVARDYYEKSMRLRERLLAKPQKDGPDVVKRQMALGVSYDKLASLNNHLGNLGQSRQFALKELEVSRAILANNPTDPLATEQLCDAYCVLGQVSAHLGDPHGSNESFARCLEAWQKSREADATNATAKRKIGTVYEAMGDCEAESGKGQEALQHYLQANQIYRSMHNKEPKNAELQWLLAYSHFRLATARRLCGDRPGAENDDRESLRLREILAKTDPNNLQRIEELMISQARCGNYQQARAAADAVRRRAPRDPSALLSAAYCYAACIETVRAKAHASEMAAPTAEALCRDLMAAAVNCVDQAISHGYKDGFSLKHSPDLAALQGSREYMDALEKLKRD